MHFIVLFGPPAVGKMSVGDEITQRTGIPVFHNHLSIEPILRFFPFGSPPFERLVYGFRRNLLEEIANSNLPGVIFSFVWSLDHKEDEEYLSSFCRIFEAVGAEITLVELEASLEQRLIRNKSEKRLLEKPSKRNIVESEERLLANEQEHRMNSDGSVPLNYRHISINNTNLTAEETAIKIIHAVGIKSV